MRHSMKNHNALKARGKAIGAAACLGTLGALGAIWAAPGAMAQSESVAPGTGAVSGPMSRPMSGASTEALNTLKLEGVISTPRATHVARFDAGRGADVARRTPRERVQLGRFLISTNRASTRFVPLATVTPRGAVYLAQQAAPSLGRANVAARLGEALAFYRQLAFYARLSSDDIADAMTLGALLSYQSATGRKLDIFSDDSNRQPRDQELLRAVRDQMRNKVRGDADLQGMDAPQKRFVAELHQMLAAIAALPPTGGAQASAQSKRQRDGRQIFQFMTGRQPGQVRLGSNGFTPGPKGVR